MGRVKLKTGLKKQETTYETRRCRVSGGFARVTLTEPVIPDDSTGVRLVCDTMGERHHIINGLPYQKYIFTCECQLHHEPPVQAITVGL